VDPDSSVDTLIFNRTVSLKDAWAKIEKTQQTPQR
jgi:glutaminyl-tRNA synthetase